MTEYATVQTTGYDRDAVLLGLAWVAQQATGGRAAVAVHGLNQVDSLGQALGIPNLRKARSFRVDPVSVQVLIQKDLRGPSLSGVPILALWLTDRYLPKVDEMRPSAVCSVPWLPEDNSSWRAARAPRDLRSGEAAERPRITNAVVEQAMESLTSTVNLGTGLTHPRDKGYAVQTFRLLRKHGEQIHADEVRAWAVANGWAARHADALSDIARRIADGRAVQAPHSTPTPKRALDEWRRRAAERG